MAVGNGARPINVSDSTAPDAASGTQRDACERSFVGGDGSRQAPGGARRTVAGAAPNLSFGATSTRAAPRAGERQRRRPGRDAEDAHPLARCGARPLTGGRQRTRRDAPTVGLGVGGGLLARGRRGRVRGTGSVAALVLTARRHGERTGRGFSGRGLRPIPSGSSPDPEHRASGCFANRRAGWPGSRAEMRTPGETGP